MKTRMWTDTGICHFTFHQPEAIFDSCQTQTSYHWLSEPSFRYLYCPQAPVQPHNASVNCNRWLGVHCSRAMILLTFASEKDTNAQQGVLRRWHNVSIFTTFYIADLPV